MKKFLKDVLKKLKGERIKMYRNVMDELKEIDDIEKKTIKRKMLAYLDKIIMGLLIMIFTIFFTEGK